MSVKELIMGIDPGVRSGVAFKFPEGEYRTLTTDSPEELWAYLRDTAVTQVAVEAFHTGGRVDESMIHTIEMVGSIRGICYVRGIPCYGQMNQARKSFIPDAKKVFEEIVGHPPVMTKDKDDHEIDALSHILCFEYRRANDLLLTKAEKKARDRRDSIMHTEFTTEERDISDHTRL